MALPLSSATIQTKERGGQHDRRHLHDHRRREHAMSARKIPTPEAGDNPGDKIPSFSPSARESASKRSKRTVACGGDTLTPCDEIPSQTLASASRAQVVTADVTESPEGAAEPDRPMEEPRSRLPPWLRRRLEQDLPPTAGTRVPPLEAHFVPRILREAKAVTSPVTPSQASVAASVTPAVTAAPIAGSICPTCQCRVRAKLSAAERQRAYRERQRTRRQSLEIGD
jgi:hypothetical protein